VRDVNEFGFSCSVTILVPIPNPCGTSVTPVSETKTALCTIYFLKVEDPSGVWKYLTSTYGTTRRNRRFCVPPMGDP